MSLLLASTSIQTPEVLLRLQRPQHHGDRGPTGHSDKVPVLNESLAQRGTLLIDRECFTQARRSCLKLNTFSWKRTCRRTVSLLSECLSLQRSILTDQSKTGRGEPCLRTAFFPPNPLEGDGSPERTYGDR